MQPRSLALPISLCLLSLVAATGCRDRRQQPAQQVAAGPQAGGRSGAGPAAGAPTAPAPPPGIPKENLACKLLTREDAEELLGGPVQEPPVTSFRADIGLQAWRCAYLSTAKNPTRIVSLLDQHWKDPAAARKAYEHAHAISNAVSGRMPESIAGLGERAYWAGGTESQLHVLAGHDWLSISNTLGPGLDQEAPARRAAVKMLAHLGRGGA